MKLESVPYLRLDLSVSQSDFQKKYTQVHRSVRNLVLETSKVQSTYLDSHLNHATLRSSHMQGSAASGAKYLSYLHQSGWTESEIHVVGHEEQTAHTFKLHTWKSL